LDGRCDSTYFKKLKGGYGMIISCSRRTDIPAFYSDWLIDKINKGYCEVRNPIYKEQISKVSLLQKDVEVIVFWSKNPKPLIPYLKLLDKKGYDYYFQFTINDYPSEFEPNLPNINERIETFKKISEMIGKNRVIWRYDPIIFSSITSSNYHLEKFKYIADKLNGFAERCVISIVDIYSFLINKMKDIISKEQLNFIELEILLKNILNIANNNQIEVFSCSEKLEEYGIKHGKLHAFGRYGIEPICSFIFANRNSFGNVGYAKNDKERRGGLR
jgi:hypothetical protein